MNLLEREIAVTKIGVAVFVTRGNGNSIHKGRLYHGLAMCVGQDILYRFDKWGDFPCRSGQIIYLPRGSDYTAIGSDRPAEDGAGTYCINFLIDGDEGYSETEKSSICADAMTVTALLCFGLHFCQKQDGVIQMAGSS